MQKLKLLDIMESLEENAKAYQKVLDLELNSDTRAYCYADGYIDGLQAVRQAIYDTIIKHITTLEKETDLPLRTHQFVDRQELADWHEKLGTIKTINGIKEILGVKDL